MTRPKIILTPAYEDSLRTIEDFIYKSTQDFALLQSFAEEHDPGLAFIAEKTEHAGRSSYNWRPIMAIC